MDLHDLNLTKWLDSSSIITSKLEGNIKDHFSFIKDLVNENKNQVNTKDMEALSDDYNMLSQKLKIRSDVFANFKSQILSQDDVKDVLDDIKKFEGIDETSDEKITKNLKRKHKNIS
ncbi:unnamed protein product [Gordionus sp. m RMFG-2023]